MQFKLYWLPKEVAEQWPKGSVVLIRTRSEKNGFTYILSLYFTPECLSFDSRSEYLLVESPESQKQNTHGNTKQNGN